MFKRKRSAIFSVLIICTKPCVHICVNQAVKEDTKGQVKRKRGGRKGRKRKGEKAEGAHKEEGRERDGRRRRGQGGSGGAQVQSRIPAPPPASITLPNSASVSSSVKWDEKVYPARVFGELNELRCVQMSPARQLRERPTPGCPAWGGLGLVYVPFSKNTASPLCLARVWPLSTTEPKHPPTSKDSTGPGPAAFRCRGGRAPRVHSSGSTRRAAARRGGARSHQ